MTMWGDMPGRNAEPDPAFEPPTADQLAQWARDDAPNADHYYQVPARDQAERDAYDEIERVDAELAEARERTEHFHGQHVSDVPPHDYQCDDGCPYETDAERDARIDREEALETEDRYATWRAENPTAAAEHEAAFEAGSCQQQWGPVEREMEAGA
jgi:hypothetical protein